MRRTRVCIHAWCSSCTRQQLQYLVGQLNLFFLRLIRRRDDLRAGEGAAGFAQRAGLQAGGLPNRGVNDGLNKTVEQMQHALPQAVQAMRDFMNAQQKVFAAQLEQRLKSTLSELKRLQDNQIVQLELRLQNQIETVKRSRFESRSRQIGRVFDDYRQWVQDTLTTEPQPWIQVLGAICNNPSTGA